MNDIKERTDKVKHDTLYHLSNLYEVARDFIDKVVSLSDKVVLTKETKKIYKMCKEFIKDVDRISLKMIIEEQEVKSLKEMRDKAKESK